MSDNNNLYSGITIVFAGVIGAGKTTASKHLVNKYHYSHLSYVDLIWLPILKERNILPTRKSLQDLGDELREKWGIRELAKMILPFVEGKDLVVIDDVRHPDAYYALQDSLPSRVFLVYIKTNTDERVPRLKIRDNLVSKDELLLAEKRATELSIGDLEILADFIIYNNGDIEEFYSEIDSCMQRISGVDD